jgi:hypothetical protein
MRNLVQTAVKKSKPMKLGGAAAFGTVITAAGLYKYNQDEAKTEVSDKEPEKSWGDITHKGLQETLTNPSNNLSDWFWSLFSSKATNNNTNDSQKQDKPVNSLSKKALDAAYAGALSGLFNSWLVFFYNPPEALKSLAVQKPKDPLRKIITETRKAEGVIRGFVLSGIVPTATKFVGRGGPRAFFMALTSEQNAFVKSGIMTTLDILLQNWLEKMATFQATYLQKTGKVLTAMEYFNRYIGRSSNMTIKEKLTFHLGGSSATSLKYGSYWLLLINGVDPHLSKKIKGENNQNVPCTIKEGLIRAGVLGFMDAFLALLPDAARAKMHAYEGSTEGFVNTLKAVLKEGGLWGPFKRLVPIKLVQTTVSALGIVATKEIINKINEAKKLPNETDFQNKIEELLPAISAPAADVAVAGDIKPKTVLLLTDKVISGIGELPPSFISEKKDFTERVSKQKEGKIADSQIESRISSEQNKFADKTTAKKGGSDSYSIVDLKGYTATIAAQKESGEKRKGC